MLGATMSTRRSLRRAVNIECSVESDAFEGTVQLPATNLSTEGVWLETTLALDEGQEVMMSFCLPVEERHVRLWAVASVVRVGMFRRQRDAIPSGMGLTFTYLSESDRDALGTALIGRPPPLPRRGGRRKRARAEAALSSLEVDNALPAVLDLAFADA